MEGEGLVAYSAGVQCRDTDTGRGGAGSLQETCNGGNNGGGGAGSLQLVVSVMSVFATQNWG